MSQIDIFKFLFIKIFAIYASSALMLNYNYNLVFLAVVFVVIVCLYKNLRYYYQYLKITLISILFYKKEIVNGKLSKPYEK
jgi:hypothetical protein